MGWHEVKNPQEPQTQEEFTLPNSFPQSLPGTQKKTEAGRRADRARIGPLAQNPTHFPERSLIRNQSLGLLWWCSG